MGTTYPKEHVKSAHEGVVTRCEMCDYKAITKPSLKHHVYSIHESLKLHVESNHEGVTLVVLSHVGSNFIKEVISVM